MEHAYFKLLHVLAGHPGWALTVVVLGSFFESIAFIGTFIPGSTAMFVAGALVGTGVLNLGWVFACAIAGAVAGDAASYWFGCRYKNSIAQLRPFRTHPGMLAAGKRYFEKHGAKSVIFARFIAPLRAVVPVVAGMLGMPSTRFLAINILSALIWAPLHILPGVVFGASIELAGAVSFRLVVLLAIAVAVTWLTLKLTTLLLSHARAWTDTSRRNVLDWARRHDRGFAGRVVLGVLDPKHQAAALIAVISVLLLVSASVFFSTLHDVSHGDPLVQVDVSVYRFLQAFRSSWGDAVLAVFATLGSVPTLGALTVLVVVWMALERRWRTMAYWLTAVAFSQLLILAIQITTLHPLPGEIASGLRAFPSNHVAASVVIYGFLAFLIARRVGMVARILTAMATVAILFSVAFAGVYFGNFTFSDAVGGAALAATWVFLIALTAVWRYPAKPPARPAMPIIVLTLVGLSVALQSSASIQATGHEIAPAPTKVTAMQWTDTVWRTFSCYRSSMDGDRREPITIQWSATAAQISAQLKDRGWTEGTHLTARSVLSLVSPTATATELPVLPRLNNGEPSALVFTRAHLSADERDVLRFWPTNFVVEHHGGQSPTPIWLGALVHERLVRPTWPFNVLRPDKGLASMIATHNDTSPWHDLEVARSAGCGGIPVTLVASEGH
ncbi:bifunctional DedA family/phosphatase PAP2 family protein [Caballeronia sordidicola]|uniref:DedA protein n=1 Tax=Caballeronia sordidicola TaxID=196367 RepID=A0A242MVP4_CABSO|nr:bifunctional DedA family/phosphatase PAP2 family protein [Caballeronia sordidicola]OTP74956.1 DedA protein [Caballeronia sordidicola]